MASAKFSRPAKKPKQNNQGTVRIIGGQHRGRKLTFPALDELRPTPNRLRETLFNWLGSSVVDSHCLDLFAGSGSLGFEALSRGAKHVTFVEQQSEAVRALRTFAEILDRTQSVQIAEADARLWLDQAKTFSNYDLIFADPPFDSDGLTWAVQAASALLKPGGLFYAETHPDYQWADIPLQLLKNSRVGDVHGWLLSHCP